MVLVTGLSTDENDLKSYQTSSSLFLFGRGGKESTEDPSSQYCSYEGANPINIKLFPCVVSIVYICPTKCLQRRQMMHFVSKASKVLIIYH